MPLATTPVVVVAAKMTEPTGAAPPGDVKAKPIVPAEVTPPEDALITTVSSSSLMSVTAQVVVPSACVVATGGLMATKPVFPLAEKVTA